MNNLKNSVTLKRNHIPEVMKNHTSDMNGNLSSKRTLLSRELVAPKSPPDTPPRTPSPSVSLERPLTPQTPGVSPATTPTVVNVNDRSSLVSPACSTSSKASSVDSQCSKRLKSGRAKHKANNAIAGLTASYNLPLPQTNQTYANSHPINWDTVHNVYNDTIQSHHLKSHLLNSSKSLPQQTFMSYQMGAQRDCKPGPHNYPTVTSLLNSGTVKLTGHSQNHNHNRMPTLINSYPQLETNNHKHSTYDYQCLPTNETVKRMSSVEMSPPLNSTDAIAVTNHSHNYRTQMNGHLVGQQPQQQRLLRPSRLDAVLIKKDFISPQISPQYETGIQIISN